MSFGPAVVLDAGGTPAFAPRTLAANVSNDGGYTVAWNNVAGTCGRRDLPAPRRDRAGHELGPHDGDHPERRARRSRRRPRHRAAELDRRAAATVLPHPPYDVFAAQRTGSFGTFGPPELVSTAALDDRGPAVPAFVARRPTVLWPVRRSAKDTRLAISSR